MKKYFESLNYCIWSAPVKYLLFWVVVVSLFWFILWQVGSITAAYAERVILQDVLKGKAVVYGYNYRTAINGNYELTE